MPSPPKPAMSAPAALMRATSIWRRRRSRRRLAGDVGRAVGRELDRVEVGARDVARPVPANVGVERAVAGAGEALHPGALVDAACRRRRRQGVGGGDDVAVVGVARDALVLAAAARGVGDVPSWPRPSIVHAGRARARADVGAAGGRAVAARRQGHDGALAEHDVRAGCRTAPSARASGRGRSRRSRRSRSGARRARGRCSR